MSESTDAPTAWSGVDEIVQRQLRNIREGEVLTIAVRHRDDAEVSVTVHITTERKARAAA